MATKPTPKKPTPVVLEREGHTVTTTNAAEAVSLRARGYRDKAPEAKTVETPATDDKAETPAPASKRKPTTNA